MCFPQLDPEKGIVEEYQTYTVAIGQFISKFNWAGNGIEGLIPLFINLQDDYKKRRTAILSLFDCNEAFINSEGNKFVDFIFKHNIKLEMGGNIHPCPVIMYKTWDGNEKPLAFTMRLAMGKVWQIDNVESELFCYGDTTKKDVIGIADAEIGFMGMRRMQNIDPEYLTGKDYKMDNLSVFLFLTSHGLLTYSRVKENNYKMLLGDYTAIVKYDNTVEHTRKGFLIKELYYHSKLVFTNKQ